MNRLFSILAFTTVTLIGGTYQAYAQDQSTSLANKYSFTCSYRYQEGGRTRVYEERHSVCSVSSPSIAMQQAACNIERTGKRLQRLLSMTDISSTVSLRSILSPVTELASCYLVDSILSPAPSSWTYQHGPNTEEYVLGRDHSGALIGDDPGAAIEGRVYASRTNASTEFSTIPIAVSGKIQLDGGGCLDGQCPIAC